MTSNLNENVDLTSLEDKIHNAMEEVMPWSMVEVQANFPTDTYWPLYRAWQKLEKENRIIFYKNRGKRRYFTKASTNMLPHIKTPTGSAIPVSTFVTHIEELVDSETGVWKQLNRNFVNKVPLLIGQLFILAKNYNKEEWLDIRGELVKARSALQTTIDWIDTILDHPAMSGSEETFVKVFGGKDAPSQDELHGFLRFVNSLVKRLNDHM